MLDLLETPITVVHAFVCVLLMLVVLIQPGKSGGLGAALGGAGAQQLFGGRGAGNFLSRATWISAVVFFMTSITLAYIATSTGDSLQDAVAAEVIPDQPASVAPPATSKPVEEKKTEAPAESKSTGDKPAAPAPVVPAAVAPVVPKSAPSKTGAAKSTSKPAPAAPKPAALVVTKPTAPALKKVAPVVPKPAAPAVPSPAQ